MSNFEKEVYEYIKTRKEVLITNIPARMQGAIPNLKNKGLVKIHKKFTTHWASKKRKFVKAKSRTRTRS
ncbi:MAG: hypothetical protein ACLFU9_02650 [Candidatus Bathyarchaeia archaeon]